MDIETKLAVTADLCCECTRNAAYYNSGWNSQKELKKRDSDFWVNLNGNFLDIAVLSWCFLFGDKKAEFKWQKLIEDQTDFTSKMYSFLKCTQQEFEDYIDSMRLYRDKRVAHRDRYLSGYPKIHFPDLSLAIDSTSFLFYELSKLYPEMQELNINKDLNLFYKSRIEHGQNEYKKALGELS